ncbi:MAG TPA: hypothetical protein VNZ52_10975 [Candidatus Thermoplasmatota archaeon]|nr:hypothetical protein [Candidatus Thermoplasmatota archaeon]
MAVDGAASQLIFFIAGTIVALGAVGVMTSVILDLNNHIDDKGKVLSEAMATDIAIVNDPNAVPEANSGGTWKIRIYVKNTGTRILDPTLFTTLYDGEYKTYDTPTYPGGETKWSPGVVVLFNVAVGSTQPTGDHVIRVVGDGGRYDELRFNT